MVSATICVHKWVQPLLYKAAVDLLADIYTEQIH